MEGNDLNRAAALVIDGDMSISEAVINFGLSSAEKKKLKEMVQATITQHKTLAKALLMDMQQHPEAYYPEAMQALLTGVYEGIEGVTEAFDLFADKKLKLDFTELRKACNIPLELGPDEICATETALPEYNVQQFGDNIIPRHRTDVLFIGPAKVGKSTLTCSVIREMVKQELATLDTKSAGDPLVKEYYDAVMVHTKLFYKPVAPSGENTLSFCPLDVKGTRKRLTIIDAGRRAFADLSNKMRTKTRKMEQIAVYHILPNSNTKLLFFLIDYNWVLQANSSTIIRYDMMIRQAITTLCYDGPNAEKPQRGCTLSRVSGLAIVFTRCDLASSEKDAQQMTQRFLQTQMRELSEQLKEVCLRYHINTSYRCQPQYFNISLGRFTVGNTMIYDPKSVQGIVDFILKVCPKQLWWNS